MNCTLNGVGHLGGDLLQDGWLGINLQKIGNVLRGIVGEFGGKILKFLLGEGDTAAGRTMGANHGLGS